MLHFIVALSDANFIDILSVIMLSVVWQRVVLPSVVMVTAIMQSVVTPLQYLPSVLNVLVCYRAPYNVIQNDDN